MLLRNLDKWVSWYLRNSISCSLFLVSTSLLSLFLFSIASILDLSSMTLFSSLVFLDSSSSIFFSRSAFPCSAYNYFLIAKVTELHATIIYHSTKVPLVECLIGSNSHFNFISDSEQQQTAFRFVKSDLSDNLIEALGEELFSDGTNAALACLSLHQFLVQHFSQSCNVYSCSLLMTHILNVVFAYQ